MVTRHLPGSAQQVWDTVTDARQHAHWIPLTRVRTDGPPRVGQRIEAVSGPGARRGGPGLVDRMRVDRYDPPEAGRPGIAVYRKLGPVVRGGSTIVVVPDGPHHAVVRWSERVHLAGPLPPAWTSVLLAPVFDGMLRLALRRAARTTDRRPVP